MASNNSSDSTNSNDKNIFIFTKHLLRGIFSILRVLTDLNVTQRYCHCPHFTDRETKVQICAIVGKLSTRLDIWKKG